MIYDIVSKIIDPEEILLITSNHRNGDSDDIDIYCITKGKSFVRLFKDVSGNWVEIFVDNISDVYKKIENQDEIAINFIYEMDFMYGDKDLYENLRIKAYEKIKNYSIPEKRKCLLRYRIKVLFSKYIFSKKMRDEFQARFILNAINYPLVQLIMEANGIFPSSPKRWISQLKENLSSKDFLMVQTLINGTIEYETLKELCQKYTQDLNLIEIDKSTNNETTFIS